MTTTESSGPKLKRGEKTFEINGGNVVYEILGKEGDFIALTPGGRFSKDIEGLRPLAQALVKGGYRVLLWDRPNCGKSDVQFYGQSESHMRAETLHALITGLDIGPCIIAGGSGGARDSMLTTMLYPEIVDQTRGVEHRRRRLRHPSCSAPTTSCRAFSRSAASGWRACCTCGEWKERIAENPANRAATPRLRHRRVPQGDAALAQRVRVQAGSDDSRRADDEMFDDITVPTLIIRGGENDWDHPKRTSLEVSCLIKGSKLIDPPWPEDAWERASEARAAGKVKRFNMFDTWVQAAPAILKFLDAT